MKSKIFLGVSIIFIIGFLAFSAKTSLTGFFATTNNPDFSKLNIITTTGMITDIVKNIGGSDVNVVGLMGSGVDPHLYRASEGDVNLLSGADVIFYNGLHLEAKMSEILESMKRTKTVTAVTDDIPRDELLDFIGFPGQYDPHVWFNVEHWISATRMVRNTLSLRDPARNESYFLRAEDYITKLEEIHDYINNRSNELSSDKRVLVTAHDAFGYFCKEYGFEVVGLQGISTEAEAGANDVQELVKFIANRKIKAIFFESSVPERNIKAVQEAVKSKGWNVSIGGELFSDAMGDEGSFEGTYIGMVKHNIDTIIGALK